MRTRISVGIVLLLAWQAAARAASLEIRVHNRAGVAAHVLARAERQASRAFEAAGVELIWTEYRPGGIPSGLKLTLIAISEISGQPLAESALGLALPTGILVFPDRSREFAQWYGVFEADVLGMALAHETGHALLGAGHSAAGLMKARLTVRDVRSFTQRHLRFTPEQSATLKRRLVAEPLQAGLEVLVP